jgi:hypothetical protein
MALTKVGGSVWDAATSKYTPAGTGAVTTDVQSKLRDRVSFGDHSTLQQTLDLGGHIYVVDDHTITATLNIPSDTTIEFVGGSITFSGSMATSSIFAATSKSNIKIIRPKAVGDITASSSNTQNGSFAYFDTCDNVQILNGTISSFPQTSVAFVDCTNCRFEGNEVYDIKSPTDVSAVCGLNIEDACVGVKVINNYIHDIGNLVSDYQGLGVRVIKQTTTMPVHTEIIGNVIEDCTEHGIVVYDGTTNIANSDPGTLINNNRIVNTGLAATDAGVGSNTRGNGIYCLGFIPGSIIGNTVESANTNSTTAAIADAGIAVMIGTGATPPQTSLIIESSVNGANSGVEIQNVNGFIINASVSNITEDGFQFSQCQNFSGEVIATDNSSTGVGVNVRVGASGCSHFNLRSVIDGFAVGTLVTSGTDGHIDCLARNFTTRGYGVTTSDNVDAHVSANPATDLELVTTTGANTDCHIVLRASDRPTGNTPFVRNNGTGVIIETWGSGLTPTVGTWAVGDKINLRTPTAGNADYSRCVTAGTVGTWKSGAAITA